MSLFPRLALAAILFEGSFLALAAPTNCNRINGTSASGSAYNHNSATAILAAVSGASGTYAESSSTVSSDSQISSTFSANVISSTAVASDTAVVSDTAAASDTAVASGTAVASSSAAASSATASSGASNSSVSFTPGLSSTFLLDLDNQPIDSPTVTSSTGVAIDAEIYVVDMEGSTADQIDTYKANGKHVVCYFTAGAWASWLPDALDFEPACYCGAGQGYDATTGVCDSDSNKVSGWDNWWLDIHNATCLDNVKTVMQGRIDRAAAKGCEGIDADNVDSFANTATQLVGNTAEDEYNYLMWLADAVHAQGMTIDLKNAGQLLIDSSTGEATEWQSSIVSTFDFSVIESCNVYSECDHYDSFLDAGKPVVELEYADSIDLTECPTLKQGQSLLYYSANTINSELITLTCQG